MDKDIFKSPSNEYKIFILCHKRKQDFTKQLSEFESDGFGGVVINAAWHGDDGKRYLCENGDFTSLCTDMQKCKEKNFGIWLYDEKGYPSGSADGLTLEGHPEYEAKGFSRFKTDGAFNLPDEYERIIYACKKSGEAVEFSKRSVTGADFCYAVRNAFVGSHAEKCGYGPRHYPNLLDKRAIASFIKCTYDKYYEKLDNFTDFKAVFTDEPSLMSAFVSTANMTFVTLPWQDSLPDEFEKMHGEDFYSVINELFDENEAPSKAKLMFWQTVAEMTNEAFFEQIEEWCASHGIKFSGHCLLEECISVHTPLYGNLLKCLKSFDYPGVDMLTANPEHFKYAKSMQYMMAAKYVGSVARMTGKTELVMCEICPLIAHNGNVEYTPEQQFGTMDLIFLCGINHINSYLSAERLKGRFNEYSDYFARAAYILRGASWNGRIALYYPIETMQSFYTPDYVGVNNAPKISVAEENAESEIFSLNALIHQNQFDYTVIDSDWICEAKLENKMLSLNGLKISVLIMPAVRVLSTDTLNKINEFEKSGGSVLWTKDKPNDVSCKLCENPIEKLKKLIKTDLTVKAQHSEAVFIGFYERDNKNIYYIINTCPEENRVSFASSLGKEYEVYQNTDGSVIEAKELIMKPYTSFFLMEK